MLDRELRRLQRLTAESVEVGGNQYHDNASYEYLVLQIRTADIRLGEEVRVLDQAEIVDLPDRPEWVQIATSVRLDIDGIVDTWHIVGYGESNWEKRRISYAAPLAKVIIGARVGEQRHDTQGKQRRIITVHGIGPLQEEDG